MSRSCWTPAAVAFSLLSLFPCSAQDLLEIGRRIYREGRLASGEPVQATVLGDVPVEGTQFTCLHCHRRSGLGGSEGRIQVLPAHGQALYRPREDMYRSRPAYSDGSLATLLRTGVDSAGRPLDSLMPVYQLPPLEMKALTAYLKTLSAEPSPGVTAGDIHLATIVDEAADPVQTAAMLEVLQSFFEIKNVETRAEPRRAESGVFFQRFENRAYRKWVLHVWRLRGLPGPGWRRQLDELYNNQPVFAVVSGMGTRSWQPVHDFCEDLKVPCLLPNVDSPPRVSDGDFYSLYFSEGLLLEAAAMAAKLNPRARSVLQIYSAESPAAAAAQAFRKRLAAKPEVHVVDAVFPSGPGGAHYDAAILWLNAADMAVAAPVIKESVGSGEVFVSSTLLQRETSSVPASLRANAYVAQPYTMETEFAQRFLREQAFFRGRKIAVNPATVRVQSQTYFACRILGEGLMHIKQNFYRDYLLDAIDHFERMAAFTAVYPRLSFGPGQRFLAKGCFVGKIHETPHTGPGQTPAWVVPD